MEKSSSWTDKQIHTVCSSENFVVRSVFTLRRLVRLRRFVRPVHFFVTSVKSAADEADVSSANPSSERMPTICSLLRGDFARNVSLEI